MIPLPLFLFEPHHKEFNIHWISSPKLDAIRKELVQYIGIDLGNYLTCTSMSIFDKCLLDLTLYALPEIIFGFSHINGVT